MKEETLLISQNRGKKTLDHIRNIAFSRTTSSIGEIRGVQYIREEMESEDIKSDTDYFSFAGPKRFLMRFFYILIFTNLILYRLFLVIVTYVIIKLYSAKLLNFSLIVQEESKNLIAKIPTKEEKEDKSVIIFSAHHDSFSALIPYKIQNVLFQVFRLFIVPFLLITIMFITGMILLKFYGIDWLQISLTDIILIYTPIEFVLLIIVFILVFNDERSSGSIDNASGVSVLIELAKAIKKNYNLKNNDIWFVWTGAEEWGLKGSKDFIKKYKEDLKQKYDLSQSYAINVDMVGSYIGLLDRPKIFNKKSQKINDIIEESAEDLNIDIHRYKKIIGPITDHKNLKKLNKTGKSNFQVACIHSDKDDKYIHSPRDRPERCSPEVLGDCVDLLFHVITKIDSMNQEL
jgi:hypothetical protein